MKLWSVVAVVMLLAVCAVAASAAPTFDGATGVVTLPTAEIAPQGTVDLAISVMPNGPEWGNQFTYYTLTAGVAKNLEISAGYNQEQYDYGYEDNITTGGAKYRLLSQAKSGVDLAIGASVSKEAYDYYKATTTKAYLAVSKDFDLDASLPLKARGTAGVLYADYKDNYDWSEDMTEPYIALELMGNQGISLGAEYRWKDSDWDDDAVFSAVLRYQLPKCPLWLQAGTTNGGWMGDGWGNQSGFYGVGYTFDLSK